MRLTEAQQLAQSLLNEISPFCLRAEIAGSIRRQKPEVKDIEIVAVPQWQEEANPDSLFAEPVRRNRLFTWALGANIYWIKPGVGEITPWTIRPEGKYWRGLLPCEIKLDLFIASPTNFGMIYVIRTGSADFTTAVVTHAKQIGLPCKDGHLTRAGQPLATPEEHDVFNLLRLQYVEPPLRTSYQSIRPIRL